MRRRWRLAFFCFGAAVLLQFLVGLYAGLLALPPLFHDTRWRERIAAIAPWVCGLAMIYLPLSISGWAERDVLGNGEFVEIYAYLRHPHHLVPSTWPRLLVERTLLFYAGAWYFLQRTRASGATVERTLLHGTILLTALALVTNYLFVEVIPWAFVAKLQPARITPLAQCVILSLIAVRVQTAMNRGAWLLAATLCLLPLSLYPGLVLGLAAILGNPAKAKPGWQWPTGILAAAVVLSFRPFVGNVDYYVERYAPWILLVAVQLIPWLLLRWFWALAAATSMALGTVAFAAFSPSACPAPLAARFKIDAPPDDPPAILGQRFGKRFPKDAVVLVPPTSEPWSFKLYARRAVVVDDKNIPFTTLGLKVWHERMEQVLGVPFTRGVDAAAAWSTRSGDDLSRLAAKFGASYILTRDAWHPEIPGRRLDAEDGWSLWQVPAAP